MMRAEPHRLVDGLDIADALIERVDRLVDHRQQNAVDDEGGEILRHRDLLAELGDELLGRFEGGVIGGDAADHLDQFHQRHRIHEMDADEALRPVGRGGQPGNRDRGGVGADDGGRLERRTQRGEDLALDVFLLGRRLDHQIAIAELVDRIGGRDALDRRLAFFVADALAADLARQIAIDGGNPRTDAVGDDVVQQHVEAGQRADMGDAVAHLAGADHADLTNGVRHPARLLAAHLRRFGPFLDVDHCNSLSTTISAKKPDSVSA